MKKLLKHIIRSILNSLGYEIRRKGVKPSTEFLSRMNTIRTSMAEVLDHFVSTGFSPSTVIDVGVAYGTMSLYTKFPNARHLLIEPLEEFEHKLMDICNRYDAEYVLAAAGACLGKTGIVISPDLVGSSFMRKKDDEGTIIREVPVITLDSVCKERDLKGPYVVKVDVQGAELLVLEGGSKILEDTELIILEVSLFRFAQGFPDFYEVIDYMKKRGFVTYEILGGHNRPLDGARAQVDIAFVQENGMFRASNAWATPEQRAEFYRLTAHK
jgi:FkbM family methyltransferase